MTIRTRILLVYLVVVGGGFYYLVNRSLGELRPRYLESMEEALVDTAHLLAAVVEHETGSGPIQADVVRATFSGAFERSFHALIYSMIKEKVDLRVYVTDAAGTVLYDSAGTAEEGKDYSRWNDVARTLQGRYGARATPTNPADPDTLVLYVSAPIKAPNSNSILGVLSIGKPTASINELVDAASRRLTLAGLAGGGLILLIGVVFAVWIATPVARLTAYARAVRDGRPAVLPRLAGREVGELRQAFEEMRAALEGKAYVENYVQTLTHELKSPLSAIRGAAEILRENPPEKEKVRFLENIRAETARIQRIVDQLLQLASLEARKAREDFKALDLAEVAAEAVATAQPAASIAGVTLQLGISSPVLMRGEPSLLSQALSNLLENALAFTPVGGRVSVQVLAQGDTARVLIEDTGSGIPDYALSRIFERFYSLPRPASKLKSTGLGLSLVREIARLHAGEVNVSNRPEGGVRAELILKKGSRA
ncbi:MAG TPA: two-component system sensor histidine kinase CreC [Opitutaceae bacterium]|nr:two-component system sensor histidine kinase CreC [Opitutaceae bacterium]